MTRRFDAITLEVVWTRLIAIVDEAAKAIVRTSFSTLSNEANDFACVLTDARGYALAQNTGSIPSFIGTLPATVRHFRRELGPDAMRPGDVLITNDPWQGTGHMSDVSLVKPMTPWGKNIILTFGVRRPFGPAVRFSPIPTAVAVPTSVPLAPPE